MKKLIIQIPCFNEAATLPETLSQLPREVEGFETVERLIIDDGSSDETVEVAWQNGVDHVVRHNRNKGLASAFMTGLEASLNRGADVIVNTDADNQYNAGDIPSLVRPILDGSADIVVGTRPINTIRHFSLAKKWLQKLGSTVVRLASKTKIPDAPSGFRALSREAAMQMNVFNHYTYTLETIIQAGHKNLTLASVPVKVNGDLRPSRLIKNIPQYIWRSMTTIVRIFVVYRPFQFFMTIGLLLFFLGFLVGLRFLYFYLSGDGAGHVQSVILSGVLLVMGFQTCLVAFLSDLLAVNRRLMEEIQYKMRKEKSEDNGHSGKQKRRLGNLNAKHKE